MKLTFIYNPAHDDRSDKYHQQASETLSIEMEINFSLYYNEDDLDQLKSEELAEDSSIFDLLVDKYCMGKFSVKGILYHSAPYHISLYSDDDEYM